MVVSPLGKYSQLVAVIISLVVVTATIIVRVLNGSGDALLDNAFWVVIGAIFGSFATVNGIKPEIDAAHKRLDAMDAPPANDGAGVTGGTSAPHGPGE